MTFLLYAIVVAAGVGSVLAANPKLLTQVISISPGETITLPFRVGICVIKTSISNATCAFSKQNETNNAKMEFIWNGNTNYFKINDETADLVNIFTSNTGYICLTNRDAYDMKITLCYLGF